jgi:steroid 5-alpha reductase family enzyme
MSKTASIDDVKRPTFGKRIFAFSMVLLTYIVALGAAIGIGYLLPTMHVILLTLIADVIATIIVFIFSVIFNNISFYDPYWSVQPIAIAIYWFVLGYGTANLIRQILILSVVSFWGLRLTINWMRGWKDIKHEDWRYTKYREDQPKFFWFIAFAGLEMMPTLVVFLGCTAMYPALVEYGTAINVFDGLAVGITVIATLIELVADEQLKIFCKKNDDPNRVMDLGLWSVSRHPNYFGEVAFWCGLFFFALATREYIPWIWTIAGPIVMILLFYAISIPLMERRQLVKKSSYADYKKRVSRFIPWFPKKE